MKNIKIGVAIVIWIGGLYFFISYSIFLYKKSSIDTQLQKNMLKTDVMSDQKSMDQQITPQSVPDQSAEKQQDSSVVIQRMKPATQAPCTQHKDSLYDMQSDFIVTNDEQDEPVAEVIADDQQEFVVVDDVTPRHNKKLHSYSFITMKVSDDYVLDPETQDTLDILIGSDVDAFVKLVLQSNNNIVSKEACRSCSMYAFFNDIKNHKPLSTDDIRMLQKMLANLYRFVEKMQKLNKDIEILGDEQYEALQNLHKTQAVKNNLKLQARRAATSAALKKLQNIKYNK